MDVMEAEQELWPDPSIRSLRPPEANEPNRALAQLDMLHSLAATLNRLDDVGQIGEAITTELRAVIDYHNCRVFVLQPDGETLLPVAFKGELTEYQGETFEALVTTVGRGLTGHVAQTGEPYYTPDADHDPFALIIPGTPEIEESMLAVPLRYGERTTGVIVLSKLGLGHFDLQDLRLLEVLASHAAVAIENARLLDAEREATAKYRALVELSPDAILVHAGGKLVFVNTAAVRLLRAQGADELLGREAVEIVHPDYRDLVADRIRRETEDGEAVPTIEELFLRLDGTTVDVEVTGIPFTFEGRPAGQVVARDITERKRVEEERARAWSAEERAMERLKALDAMKNTFLEAVSHDLRTPLTALLGHAVTLAREDLELPPEEARELLLRLVANARKLDRLLTDLLDLDRLSRGVIEARRQPTDLAGLVRQVVAECDQLHGHTVVIDVQPFVAAIDGAKVERMVDNLLRNSLRHTPSGTTVWVRASRSEGGILIAVEDDGPGVPAGMGQAIFEPFRQGPTQAAHAPGVGIGLSLVARFAELHGGRAWVQERQGGGASFRVFLPC
jgi:PAS domain S-box-containing protein